MRVAIEVQLASADGRLFVGQVEDLSAVGLRMITRDPPAEGTHCSVVLDIVGERVEARGTVVRVEPERVALRFDELPYESYERLRIFLVRQADDPSTVDGELAERLGFLGEEDPRESG